MKKEDLLEWVRKLPEDATIGFCSYHEDDCLCAIDANNNNITTLTHAEVNADKTVRGLDL